MKRRRFVQGLGMTGLAPVLAACSRIFRIPIDVMARPEPAPDGDRDPDGVWSEAAAYARWTPSPHNIQPWRLHLLSATEAELYADPHRLLPVTDPTSAFTIAGLGMFVEYLSVAMQSRGYEITADYENKPLDYTVDRPILFARLRRVAFRGDATWDRQLILERKTSRLPYDGAVVDDEALQRLARIAGEQGHTFSWSSDAALVQWTVDLNRFTLFSDLDDAPTRGELRKWIRTTDAEAARSKDGLWSHCLRFPGWVLKDFFDAHSTWGKGWRADLCGKLLVRGMRGTRTVAWFSGPFDRPDDWIRAGVLMSRSWLELTKRGIGLHPFGSIITNTAAHARLREKLGPQRGADQLWMLIRLGRSDAPPRSYRLDEHAIFITARELA